jgi:hypothetical protein
MAQTTVKRGKGPTSNLKKENIAGLNFSGAQPQAETSSGALHSPGGGTKTEKTYLQPKAHQQSSVGYEAARGAVAQAVQV